MTTQSEKTEEMDLSAAPTTPGFLTRASVGGALMGLANLVLGISGGTMLLASGVFPQFVQAVADITRLRFSRQAIFLLATIGISAALVIGFLAGPVSYLVVSHTWIMYSLFIGLTLGGVPLIWKMAVSKTPAFWIGAAIGLIGMIVLVQIQGGTTDTDGSTGFFYLLIAGILAASAMVLPGISGSYLLLLLGVYVTILQGVEEIMIGVRTFNIEMTLEPAFGIALPVGIGVLLGIAGVSNLAKFLLARFPQPSLGLLLGLLLGAVAGLWPFQHGIEPDVNTVLKGQTIIEEKGEFFYEATGNPVDPRDYERETFTPATSQVAGAIAIAGLGFLLTVGIARVGGQEE